MPLIGERIGHTANAHAMLLAAGVPMFAIGAVTEIGGLAVGGMLLTLVGLLTWIRRRSSDVVPQPDLDHRPWRPPVAVLASLTSSIAASLAIGMLHWIGSR